MIFLLLRWDILVSWRVGFRMVSIRRSWSICNPCFWGIRNGKLMNDCIILLMEEILHQLIWWIYPIMVSYMSGDMSGGARFLPSTVCLQNVTSYFVITFRTHLAPSPPSSFDISTGLFCRFCAGANQLFSRVQCPRTCGNGWLGGTLCDTCSQISSDLWCLTLGYLYKTTKRYSS